MRPSPGHYAAATRVCINLNTAATTGTGSGSTADRDGTGTQSPSLPGPGAGMAGAIGLMSHASGRRGRGLRRVRVDSESDSDNVTVQGQVGHWQVAPGGSESGLGPLRLHSSPSSGSAQDSDDDRSGPCRCATPYTLPLGKYASHCYLDTANKTAYKTWSRSPRRRRALAPDQAAALAHTVALLRAAAPASGCPCPGGIGGRHSHCQDVLVRALAPAYRPHSRLKVNCVFFREEAVAAYLAGDDHTGPPPRPKLESNNKKDMDTYLRLMAATMALADSEREGGLGAHAGARGNHDVTTAGTRTPQDDGGGGSDSGSASGDALAGGGGSGLGVAVPETRTRGPL
jgi:hypothetical protein